MTTSSVIFAHHISRNQLGQSSIQIFIRVILLIRGSFLWPDGIPLQVDARFPRRYNHGRMAAPVTFRAFLAHDMNS
jgi:hypothetical protein